jgi:hypothetical protein
MRNFGIREADIAALGITITEEINPSAINTKWETAIAEAVGGYSPWLAFIPMEERRTSAVIKATLARDRLLRTMEICGHIPRWEPPVIQAAPAPTPVIQPPQAAPAPPAAPAVQAPQAVQVNPHPQPHRTRTVRNPLTGRQILKSGALYKKLQRQGKIPDDPQTPQQRRQDMHRAWREAHRASIAGGQGAVITWADWRREYDLAFEPQRQQWQQQQQQLATQQQQQWEQRRRRRVEAAAAGALDRLEAQRTAAREQRPTEQPTEPCAICMDDTYTDPLRLRECGHTYCYECIKHWHTSRHGSAKCPTCRTDIQRNPALA